MSEVKQTPWDVEEHKTLIRAAEFPKDGHYGPPQPFKGWLRVVGKHSSDGDIWTRTDRPALFRVWDGPWGASISWQKIVGDDATTELFITDLTNHRLEIARESGFEGDWPLNFPG